MKNHLLLLLLFVLGGSLFIGSCTKNQPLQSMRWPPDTTFYPIGMKLIR